MLDRFLIDGRLMEVWPNIVQHVHPHSVSDHNPVLLFEESERWGPVPFKLFDHWMEMNNFESMVSEFFEENVQAGLWEKMRSLKHKIKMWKKNNVADTSARIKEIEVEMERVEKEGEDSWLSEEQKQNLKEQRRELDLLYMTEEKELIQKSRIRWAKEGDRNTKYFHQAVAARRRSNNISVLRVGDRLMTRQDEIKEVITGHFQNHFNNVVTTPIESLDIGLKELSAEKVKGLESCFTMEEIKAAVENCDGSRAPGPDGYNIKFFKKYWRFIKNDLKKILDDFHDTGVFNRNLNSSFITLLPKCQNPESIDEYRPISLVGSIYKVIAKMLATRLKPMMNELVEGTNLLSLKGGRLLIQS